jgi:transcriptional regulator with PAS, ATPase and Fis domain
MAEKGATPRRWPRLLENAGEAIVLLDHHWRIVFVNASAERLLGADSDDLLGLMCRRGRSGASAEPMAALADFLSAPTDVKHVEICHARRMIPDSKRAVDIEFIPLSRDEGRSGLMAWLRPAGSAIDAPVDVAGAQLVELAGAVDRRYDLRHFPACSRVAQRAADQVRLAARIDSPVLFRGEKGTGKSWLARSLHQLSRDRDGAWMQLDCERLPPTALTRALTGWVPVEGQPRASIYLDQVHRLPRELQAELASWRHAGGISPRILAGTDADMHVAEVRWQFLQEFAEWLSLFEITVAPLRERTEDLLAWLEVLARRLGHLDPGQDLRLLDPVKDLVLQYQWPGNLDEMLLVVNEIGQLSTGAVELAQLPARLRRAVNMASQEQPRAERRVDLDQVLAEVERRLLRQALDKTHGNKSRAADLLGIWRARLIRRMQALGMGDADEDHTGQDHSTEQSKEIPPECEPGN